MKTLLEIYEKYDTNNELVEFESDKNSCHTYIEDVYEEYLAPYRDKKISVLEIGVSWSGSIRMWKEYFKNAKIYGMDDFSCGNIYREKSLDLIDGKVKNVTIIEGDAYSDQISSKVDKIDIIIDDGPHTLYTQERVIDLYLPKLNPGGLFFIEDIPIDFNTDLEHDDLGTHPWMQSLLNRIPGEKYSYKIFDLRKNASGRCGNPEIGRGDNIILAISHTE